jgi:hypothetical protein
MSAALLSRPPLPQVSTPRAPLRLPLPPLAAPQVAPSLPVLAPVTFTRPWPAPTRCTPPVLPAPCTRLPALVSTLRRLPRLRLPLLTRPRPLNTLCPSPLYTLLDTQALPLRLQRTRLRLTLRARVLTTLLTLLLPALAMFTRLLLSFLRSVRNLRPPSTPAHRLALPPPSSPVSLYIPPIF